MNDLQLVKSANQLLPLQSLGLPHMLLFRQALYSEASSVSVKLHFILGFLFILFSLLADFGFKGA